MQPLIIDELSSQIVDCVMHQNGNHVIQKCIMSVSQELLDTIIDSFVGKVACVHAWVCVLCSLMV